MAARVREGREKNKGGEGTADRDAVVSNCSIENCLSNFN